MSAVARIWQLVNARWLAVVIVAGGFSFTEAGSIGSGFNDVSGINADNVANRKPFNTADASLDGQGNREYGWSGPWLMSVGAAVVSTTAYEGDGAAAFFQNTAAADRTLLITPTDSWSVTLRLLLPTPPTLDVIFRVYDNGSPSIFSAIAVQWSVGPSMELAVLDGVEDSIFTGGTYAEGTGMFLTPGVWHELKTVIDPGTRTWDVFLDGVRFIAPDPLGYRGVPVNVNSIQFLNEIAAPSGSYIDAVVVESNSFPPPPRTVPEPTTAVLASIALLAALGRRAARSHRK